jgi:hypothetical protein
MSGISIPTEPVAVFLVEGDRVNTVARYAEFIRQRFGAREASGLREAHHLPSRGETLVFIGIRSPEFVHFLEKQPGWERLRLDPE